MKKPNWRDLLAHVELQNYPGYPHYHAEVCFESRAADIRVKLQYTLTRRDAAEMNKDEQRGGSSYRYRPGAAIDKFPDRESAERAAAEFFRSHLIGMGARVLISGSRATCSVQPILAVAAGLEEAMERLNAIEAKVDEIERGYRPFQKLTKEDEARIGELWDDWERALKVALKEGA